MARLDLTDLIDGVASKGIWATVTPYLIAFVAAAFLTVSGIALYWKHQANEARDEIVKLQVKEVLHEEAVASKDIAINGLRAYLIDCSQKRAAAEDRADKAESVLKFREGLLKTQVDKDLNELKNETPAVCSTPVSPRTTELLVAAANRANRAGGSTED